MASFYITNSYMVGFILSLTECSCILFYIRFQLVLYWHHFVLTVSHSSLVVEHSRWLLSEA